MRILFLIVLFIHLQSSYAQTAPKGFYAIGFTLGSGTIDNFLFNDKDYSYQVDFHKLQLYYRLKQQKVEIDFLLEPQYNRASHKLLNYYFVDTDEERKKFMQEKTIQEYILGIGILIRKPIREWLQPYVLISIGPGYFNTGTERLAKGFAFADVIALGIKIVTFKNINLDIRPSFRHVSNANLNYPNSGYNSLNIEFGLNYTL